MTEQGPTRRVPGIDYDGLPAALAATAVEPGDPEYGAVRSTYLRGGRPGLVLRPRSVGEVREAVAFARRHTHVPLGVRSGGHGISGRSTNVRGAGANFGIATAFEFVVDEVPDIGWAQLAFQVADPAAFLVEFGRVTVEAPRETTPNLIMGGSGVARMLAMVASDDPDVVVAQLQPFAQIAPLVQQQVVIAPYAAVMNLVPQGPHHGVGEPVSRAGLVRDLTPAVAEASARLLASGAVHWFQLRSMGGAIADVPRDATAFAHRDASFSITAMGANAQRVDRSWDELRPLLSGSYLSFETDTSCARIAEAFPPDTLARLRALKAELDPTNLFRDNFNIRTSAPSGSLT